MEYLNQRITHTSSICNSAALDTQIALSSHRADLDPHNVFDREPEPAILFP